MYVDYEFYKNNYGGRISPFEFPRLKIQASNIVDYYTFNRIETVDDRVKYAVCELVDYLKEVEDKGGKEVASEKVSTHSVTYVVGSKEGTDPVKQKQKDIVKKWLGHTGLMYRGV
jgi:hypothetical protein